MAKIFKTKKDLFSNILYNKNNRYALYNNYIVIL